MTEKEYLQHMVEALTDGISIEHEDACGQCHKQRINGKLAKRLLKYEILVSLAQYSETCQRIWHHSKYVKFYEERIAAGRTMEEAFKDIEAKGWQP